MKICLFLFLASAQLFGQTEPVKRIPLIREGSKIVGATGALSREEDTGALVISLERNDAILSTMVILPNQRLAEMEAVTEKNQKADFEYLEMCIPLRAETFFSLKKRSH